MDGQRETRPCRKRYGPKNGPGYYQGQREVETSCENLIVGEHRTEEKRRRNQRSNKETISGGLYIKFGLNFMHFMAFRPITEVDYLRRLRP